MNSNGMKEEFFEIIKNKTKHIIYEENVENEKLREESMVRMDLYDENEHNWSNQFDKKRTFGEMIADHVAKTGGSWTFILSILAFVMLRSYNYIT